MPSSGRHSMLPCQSDTVEGWQRGSTRHCDARSSGARPSRAHPLREPRKYIWLDPIQYERSAWHSPLSGWRSGIPPPGKGGVHTIGSGLARRIFTLQQWSEQPCVRPVCAVPMTAGHNALRGSGPGQNLALGLHIGRRHQSHRMSQRLQLPGPMVG